MLPLVCKSDSMTSTTLRISPLAKQGLFDMDHVAPEIRWDCSEPMAAATAKGDPGQSPVVPALQLQ